MYFTANPANIQSTTNRWRTNKVLSYRIRHVKKIRRTRISRWLGRENKENVARTTNCCGWPSSPHSIVCTANALTCTFRFFELYHMFSIVLTCTGCFPVLLCMFSIVLTCTGRFPVLRCMYSIELTCTVRFLVLHCMFSTLLTFYGKVLYYIVCTVPCSYLYRQVPCTEVYVQYCTYLY